MKAYKARCPDVLTKSGLMLGIGETKDEVIQVMKDMRAKDIDMIIMYQAWIRESKDFTDSEDPTGYRQRIDRKMGRIGNVNDTKEILERLFKES